MRRIRLLSLVAAFALVGALAACDEDGDDAVDDVTEDVEDITDDIREDAEDIVDDVTNGDAVTIEGFAYSPDDITVDSGTTITWTNEDSVPHTVTAGTPDDPTGEFAEELSPGDSADITFDDAGSFDYFCEFHNQMRGTVTVE